MKKLILVIIAAAVLSVGCNQQANVSGPSPIGAALESLKQLAQSTIAVLDGENDPGCTNGCRVSKWTNYPSEPPSPINWTQGGLEDGCVQAYGSGWVGTHLYCEEEGTCQPEDSWGLMKLRICAYQP